MATPLAAKAIGDAGIAVSGDDVVAAFAPNSRKRSRFTGTKLDVAVKLSPQALPLICSTLMRVSVPTDVLPVALDVADNTTVTYGGCRVRMIRGIVSGPAIDDVVAAAAAHEVVALAAGQHVGSAIAEQQIVEVRTDRFWIPL